MNDPTNKRRRVAVIGGGISGLAAAHRLVELEPAIDVTLFEARGDVGGVLKTERIDGYLVEHSADNFITNVPWAVDLCRRIGFEDQLIPTSEAHRRALVLRRGKLYPVPEGFVLMAPSSMWAVATTPLLSLRGKLRLLGEYFVPPRRDAGDESLASFAVRRLGREAFDRLVQPLVGGIYTGDASKLSLLATLPRFAEMEQTHGGLIRAMRKARAPNAATARDSGARYSLFVAPREGMASFAAAVAARLPFGAVRLDTPVTGLSRLPEGGWSVETANDSMASDSATDAPAQSVFDGVIVATPASRAADLLRPVSKEIADAIGAIPLADSAVAVVGYRREQIRHPLDGFGFVVPEVEERRVLAASFSSIKYAGRAPEGHVLLRVFLGGPRQPELASRPESELERIVVEELAEILGVAGPPQFLRVLRWGRTMPQYQVGHLDLVARIEGLAAALPGLQLAGNAYRGVGVPHCVKSGERAAEALLGRGDGS